MSWSPVAWVGGTGNTWGWATRSWLWGVTHWRPFLFQPTAAFIWGCDPPQCQSRGRETRQNTWAAFTLLWAEPLDARGTKLPVTGQPLGGQRWQISIYHGFVYATDVQSLTSILLPQQPMQIGRGCPGGQIGSGRSEQPVLWIWFQKQICVEQFVLSWSFLRLKKKHKTVHSFMCLVWSFRSVFCVWRRPWTTRLLFIGTNVKDLSCPFLPHIHNSSDGDAIKRRAHGFLTRFLFLSVNLADTQTCNYRL